MMKLFALLILAPALSLASALGSLVSVQSHYWDLATDQIKKVEGVGTVVVTAQKEAFKDRRFKKSDLNGGRFFVLTAGHISSGDSLTVLNGAGESLAIRSVFHDSPKDLTLIELDKAKINLLPVPLGYFITSPDGNYLLAHLGDWESQGSYHVDDLSSQLFKSVPIESLAGFAATGGTSAVLIPDWLKSPQKNDLIEKPDSVLRGLESSEYHVPLSFERGLSGAPVVISYATPKGRYTEHLRSFFYVLSGVLTASSNRDLRSEGGGARAISTLIERALKTEEPAFDSRPIWFLVGDLFAKMEDELTLFFKMGPIGNGLVVNGAPAKHQIRQTNLEPQLNKRGITPTKIAEFRSSTQGLDQQTSQAEKGVLILKGLQESMGSDLKIQVK